MTTVDRNILQQVIAATSEPLLIIRIDQPDWPVALANPAFESICGKSVKNQPFADVMESLSGREVALEVSEAVRSRLETSLPVELKGREHLLILRPLTSESKSSADYYVALWRTGGAAGTDGAETHHALLKAKRRIRDLSRDDPVTGLLNDRAFADIFEHDWAVSSREKGKLSLVILELEDFQEYEETFGRHASDSCMRRVGQVIRRCLKRASDVVARPDGHRFVVLSHASEEEGVRKFAGSIASAVRDLGIHHPRSNSSKFVTVAYAVAVADVSKESRDARTFLAESLTSDRD